MNARYSPITSVALLFSFAVGSVAAAQDSWVGQQFMPRAEAQYKAGDAVVPEERLDLPLKVERVQGEWLWVGRAWVLKRHVIPVASAEAYYTERLRRSQQDPWAWSLRGIARQETKNYEGALRDLTQAIRLAPNTAAYYLHRADVRFLFGDVDGVLSDLDAAVRVEPNNAWVYYQLADRYSLYLAMTPEDEDFDELADEVIGYLSTALRLDPTLQEIYAGRGLLYEEKGDLHRALEDYDQAVRFFPEKVHLYGIRARLKKGLEDYRGAIADYEHVAQHTKSENLHDAYDDLARMLATCPDRSLRNGPRAIQLATKACELSHWRSFVSLETLAAAYAETGDFASAVRWQTKALESTNFDVFQKPLRDQLELYRQGKPYVDQPSSHKTAPQDQT